MINKKFVALVIGLVSLIVIVVVYVSYINSKQTIVVSYKNISGVTLTQTDDEQKLGQKTVISKSGEKLNISKGTYLLNYTGRESYASDSQVVYLQNNPVSVSLDPDFSDKKLSTLLDEQFETIKSVLNEKYTNINQYVVAKGKLYKKGEWYGTTLQYNGNDEFNYDSLRLVMNKKDDKWTLVTDPPSISLSSQSYPTIPIDVLRDVNNVQNSNFAPKFTDEKSKVYFP